MARVPIFCILIASAALAESPAPVTFYKDVLPVLQKHLDTAKDLLNKTGNTASAR